MSTRTLPFAASIVSIAGLGVALFTFFILHLTFVDEIEHLFDPHHIVELGLLTLFPTSLLLGVSWLSKKSFRETVRRRIAGWVFGSMLSVGALALLVLYAIEIPLLSEKASFMLPVAAGIGANAGFIIGTNEARAIQHADASARAELSAEFAEAERVRLKHLNDLLRHDILNSVMVIQAMADVLLESNPDETARDRLERIRRQSDLVTELIQNVRVLAQLPTDEYELEAVDLTEILTVEIAALNEAYPAATIDLTIPEDVYVHADALVGSIFMNLVRNGIIHNDSDAPHVSLTVTKADDTVSVRVEDNGPGLPAYVMDTLFEQQEHTDHGLGLYLVKTLVEKYDGTISLTSTGDEGTVFTVALSAVSASDPLSIRQ
ncbi:HAMP domain-containing sensor histidine kinase [Haladaptatus sp. CMSO5]|uniref:HAMP domain-containing sensor histidine kinase n=1 Tax=Haladaptatus sp. CMSO5 TaxID=3120514 RepID=UPI002FCDF9D2